MPDTPDQLDQTAGGGGLLDYLTQLLSPSDAGAASRPDPNEWTRQFLLRQQAAQAAAQQKAQANQQLYQQRSQQTQADPMYQAKLQAAQQKANPTPPTSIADLITGGGGQGEVGNAVERPSMPGDVLGGGPGAPITFGRNPRTGDYSFNNFGYVNDPTYDAGAPDWLTGRALTAAQAHSTPQMKQQVEQARQSLTTAPTGATGTSSTRGNPDPQLIQKHAMIVQQLTKMGYSPTQAGGIADMAVPEIGQAAKQSKRSDAQLAAGEKPLEKASSSFINQDTGERAKPNMTHADMTSPNSPWLALDTDQEKVWDGLNTMKAHILGTEQYLNQLPQGGSMWRSRPVNQFIMFLRKQTDERAQALADQMDNLTPIALSRTFAAGGRGGPTLATMIRKGGVNSGDTVEMAIEKLKNLKGMGFQLAKDNGLPTKPFGPDWEAANQKMTGGTPGTTAGGAPMQAKSKSGKPIVSKDGGKTWEYQ